MGCGELSSASRVETLRCGERDVLIWTWRVEASSGTCWKPLGGDVCIEPTRSPAVGAAKAGVGARARAAREEACGGKGAPRLPTREERRAPHFVICDTWHGPMAVTHNVHRLFDWLSGCYTHSLQNPRSALACSMSAPSAGQTPSELSVSCPWLCHSPNEYLPPHTRSVPLFE